MHTVGRFTFFFLCLFSFLSSARASHPPRELAFQNWIADFREAALSEGISAKTLNAALSSLSLKEDVIALDRNQPESKLTLDQYLTGTLTKQRIQTGRRLLRQHARALQAAERKYGVSAKYIVALWGIETSYGQRTGGIDTISALATLAFDGRRAEFFRGELLDALRILEQGHISADEMRGSWAGAMGQNQFMPSSFLKYAVDSDGDGKKDIWNTKSDVFASTAHYLSEKGWMDKQRWGREVSLPKSFDAALVGYETQKTLQEWAALGVRLPGGGALPVHPNLTASILAPDGLGGKAFVVYSNFRTLLEWNRSGYFAIAVGTLADRISR